MKPRRLQSATISSRLGSSGCRSWAGNRICWARGGYLAARTDSFVRLPSASATLITNGFSRFALMPLRALIAPLASRCRPMRTSASCRPCRCCIGHYSLFSRIQQFAGRVYGGLIARGVAAWSGNEGNYWGHNAIIRVAAFAEACGMPQLPGRKPFGGHVLSHDFVEAALMRRAGWKVRMAPDLDGSWEESPPSLDRRRGARPALGAGQSAALQDHRRRWACRPIEPRVTSPSAS